MKTRTLTWVNVVGNQLKQKVALAIEHNTSLKSLCIGDNEIGQSGAKAITNFIKQNRRLEYLSIGG